MLINDALQLIHEMNPEELLALTRDDIMIIIDGMDEDARGQFLMEKNVKVFGGINNYVNDFLEKVNILKMNKSGKEGAVKILNRMLGYHGISHANAVRIRHIIHASHYETAPAAGGRRKTRRTRR